VTDSARPPVYSSWGAPPQPVLGGEPKRSSWFGSSIVVLVMLGWMVLVLGLGALVSRNDPNVEVPVEVALGVVVTPADGWYSAAERWDVGEDAVSLQSSGVFVGFWVERYQGTNGEYLDGWLDDLAQEFDRFRPLPAASVTAAGDLPGLMVYFSGVSTDLGQEEGELVVVTHGGIAVAMWVRAEPGQLAWVQGDLDSMLYHLAIPR
jgi:hypothetical protein